MTYLWFVLFVAVSVLFVNGPNLVLPRKIAAARLNVFVSYVVCAFMLFLLCFFAKQNFS